ncbi:hypothetical protein SETIT_4G166200v2 [Setaria italica]|uniref:Uncharacterized protein n=1 Tax=Setaria italica TaxID=4555 RepID=A0A368QV12_SETIT|nr:hypothetical protein SETIT_4G166200v2 [Setaria italica]
MLYVNLVSNYSSTVPELYSMGARKFALINVGLQGCCWDSLNQLGGGFNDALRSRLAGLAPMLPGVVYSLADLLGFTRDTLADPRASGNTNIVGACCGSGWLSTEAGCFPNTLCTDGDQHVFKDRVRFSQWTAFLITQAFYNGPAKRYTTPINFMQRAQSSNHETAH